METARHGARGGKWDYRGFLADPAFGGVTEDGSVLRAGERKGAEMPRLWRSWEGSQRTRLDASLKPTHLEELQTLSESQVIGLRGGVWPAGGREAGRWTSSLKASDGSKVTSAPRVATATFQILDGSFPPP